MLGDKVFERSSVITAQDTMTIDGTVRKTLLLLLIAAATGLFTWTRFFEGQNVGGYLLLGVLGGLVVALVTVFKPHLSPFTAPLYAALEGLALGGISAMYHAEYAGLPAQAIALTLGVLFVTLAAYTSGALRATERFRMGVIAATGAVVLVYLVSFVLGLFGMQVPMIHDSGPVGIIFSLVVVGIAALNLILDFDFIERGSQGGAPKFLEWYGAFGLLVTLVWLYLEILRLLGKLRSR
ncbi:MAG: Bax inhibitor-1/YccA family protein [Actinomycetota bacterium]|nr:Bax inhibitor-1/YccA family protein [Actinomycetota bacterium]